MSLLGRKQGWYRGRKRGVTMVRSVTQRKNQENYQESQERMVVSLLNQVGNGYTAARLQIALQHIHLIPQTKKTVVSFGDIF